MNILVTCSYWYYADFSYSFIHAQAKAYAAAGQRVRVLIPLPLGRRLPEGTVQVAPGLHRLEWDGVEIDYVTALSLSNFGNRRAGRYSLNDRAAMAAFRRLLPVLTRDFQPDVVHAHTLGYGSEVGAWLSQRLGCPLVVTTHGGDMLECYREKKYEDILRQTRLCPHIVCVSSSLKECLQEIGVDTDLRIILNGFHTGNVCRTEEKRPCAIVQVGNLIERKKADITVRAFARLRETYPDMTLTEVGEGPLRPQLETLRTELRLGDSMILTGRLPNSQAMAEMAKAQFFCMPSVREGFGIVYAEAMASGCITIGTEGEGVADVIRSGENGFLVPPDDPDAIGAVISWCLSHPAEAAAIARRGRETAMGLTWAHNAAQYIQLFKELQT